VYQVGNLYMVKCQQSAPSQSASHCAMGFWRSYTYPSPFTAMNLQFLCTSAHFTTPPPRTF